MKKDILIKELNNPNEQIIKEIREVEAICKTHDNLTGNIYLDLSLNFDQNIKSLFLLYENEKLVSILTVFLPTSQEAEISAFTLPEYRKNGFFKLLMEKAIIELEKYNVSEILFVCENTSESGKAAIEKVNCYYHFSEYFLRFTKDNISTINDYQYQTKLIKAERNDLEKVIKTAQKVFNDNYDDSRNLILKSLNSENRNQFIVLLNNDIVGLGATSFANDEIFIYGLGIIPEYQGKGFGKELLFLIIKNLLEQNKASETITIEVNSDNQKAFELYKKSGFVVESTLDYYRMKI